MHKIRYYNFEHRQWAVEAGKIKIRHSRGYWRAYAPSGYPLATRKKVSYLCNWLARQPFLSVNTVCR